MPPPTAVPGCRAPVEPGRGSHDLPSRPGARTVVTIMNRNGVRIAYDDSPGDGPLVVPGLRPGAPGRVWPARQVPALRAAGHRVVTLDNRGAGASDDGAEGFTIDDMVGDVAALVEHLDAGPAAVIGTSLGA